MNHEYSTKSQFVTEESKVKIIYTSLKERMREAHLGKSLNQYTVVLQYNSFPPGLN